MPDLAFAPGPKVAGKRIPVPAVKGKRPAATKTAAATTTAAKSIGGAAKAGGHAAGAGARAAGKAAGNAARSASTAASNAARSASTAAGNAARSASTAARSARRGAKTGFETGRAAVRFAQNVTPAPRERSTAVHRAPAVAAAIAAGAGLEYLLDPADGKRRRHTLRDKTVTASRRVARRGAQRARYAEGKVEGTVRAATSTPKQVDDQTLADRVRTEIFRRVDAPKSGVNVGVVDCVVTLRGEVVDAAQIQRLVDDARAVPGVRSVQNLLHTPGVPAPTGGPA
jgi:osmotically-inducible protein OsmY